MIGRLVCHFYTERGVFLSKGGSQTERKKEEKRKERRKKGFRNLRRENPSVCFLVSRFFGEEKERGEKERKRQPLRARGCEVGDERTTSRLNGWRESGR